MRCLRSRSMRWIPKQPSCGRPQEAAHPPGRLRELVVGEPPAGLQHGDPVALLGQAQRGDAAAESGPDDHHVVRHTASLPAGNRSAQDPGGGVASRSRRPQAGPGLANNRSGRTRVVPAQRGARSTGCHDRPGSRRVSARRAAPASATMCRPRTSIERHQAEAVGSQRLSRNGIMLSRSTVEAVAAQAPTGLREPGDMLQDRPRVLQFEQTAGEHELRHHRDHQHRRGLLEGTDERADAQPEHRRRRSTRARRGRRPRSSASRRPGPVRAGPGPTATRQTKMITWAVLIRVNTTSFEARYELGDRPTARSRL